MSWRIGRVPFVGLRYPDILVGSSRLLWEQEPRAFDVKRLAPRTHYQHLILRCWTRSYSIPTSSINRAFIWSWSVIVLGRIVQVESEKWFGRPSGYLNHIPDGCALHEQASEALNRGYESC